MAFAPFPRLLGGGVALEAALPVSSPTPAAQGGGIAAESSVPFFSLLPTLLGGGSVIESALPIQSPLPRILGGGLVLEGTDGGYIPTLVSSPPRVLGGGLVLESILAPQFDETNRMTDALWRDLDYLRYSDYIQLIQNQSAWFTLFSVAHDPSTGEHDPSPNIEESTAYFADDFAATFSGLATDAYETEDWTFAHAFRPMMITARDISSVSAIEPILIYDSERIVHGFRALAGGSVRATIKSWKFYNDADNPEDPDLEQFQPTIYDAAVIGFVLAKNTYHQVFDSTLEAFLALVQWHSRGTGEQSFSVKNNGIRSVANRATMADLPEAGDVGVLEVGSIASSDEVWFSNAIPATGSVSVRTGFDDGRVYAVVEAITAPTGEITVRSAPMPVFGSSSSAHTLNITPTAQISHTATDAQIDQLNANTIAILALIQQEHRLKDGAHRIPLTALSGYRVAVSDQIEVPSTVGSEARYVIEANPNDDANAVYLPVLEGDPGSGVVSVSIAFDAASSYLIVRRESAGTTNTFSRRVYVVDGGSEYGAEEPDDSSSEES